MIDLDLLIFAILVLVLLIFTYKTRKRIEIQKIIFPILYIIIYRTKLGLTHMDRFSKKFPKALNFIGYISIIVGFLGMAFIIILLLKGTYEFLFLQAPSPVGLVLPRVEIAPGFPRLSFMHWIVAIFVLATIHEFSHGVFARLNNIKVKSSGFAMLGVLFPILPAAFVEPDEKIMAKAKKKAQLEILSAGSFSNFIAALLALVISIFLIVPFTSNMIIEKGVYITGVEENGPAEEAGIRVNESIIAINNVPISNLNEFRGEIDKYSPFEKITIQTHNSSYQVTLGESVNDPKKGHMGVFLIPIERVYNPETVDKYGELFIRSSLWIAILFSWLFIINLGVGLFNLLPLGVLDGGKMFYLGVLHLTKNEALTKTIWKYTNIFLIAILLVLILPQLYKLLIAPIFSFIL